MLLIVALACWYVWWRRRHQPAGRRYLLLAASSALIPILIASAKRFSPLHCAWDVDRYGGYAPYADVLTRIPDNIAAGHCFPAAFLTSASWLMALALFFYPRRRRLALLTGLTAFCLALALGWVQQMRGAHFFSHTLWSLWLSWAVIIVLHYALRLWRVPGTQPQHMPHDTHSTPITPQAMRPPALPVGCE